MECKKKSLGQKNNHNHHERHWPAPNSSSPTQLLCDAALGLMLRDCTVTLWGGPGEMIVSANFV